MQKVALNNGIDMPTVGLGTWQMQGGECERAVGEALKAGYRHIDTAAYYGNERDVGKAIRKSGIPREEIFVTTKLWPTDFFDPRKAFEKSLWALGLKYVDLYLIHWPVPGQSHNVWRALEKIYEEKLGRAIGISNYGIGELRRMLNPCFGFGDIKNVLSYANVLPAVNQIKFNPFDYEKEILEYCKEHRIFVEAYSPLTRSRHLSDAVITRIAKKHGKTPAQIMIRWCIEHGTVPLPKSSHPDRIRENIDVFDYSLDEIDMATLDQL